MLNNMNRIEKLIAELCPNGVEWKKLGEVAEIGTGSSNRQDENKSGIYPFYVRSKNILKSDKFEFDETAIIIPGEGGIGDIFHYVEGKYSLHQRAYRVHIVLKYINTKFLYYFMCQHFKSFICKKSVGATATSIRKPMLEQFPIPIPPLPVQEEIVKILDTFTELEAELEARKKQYEYYRNQLLTPVEVNGRWFLNGKEVEWKKLGDVCEICSGGTPSKNKEEYWINGDIPWLKSEVCNNKSVKTCNTFINELGLKKSNAKIIKENTTLMALVGATIFKTAFLEFNAAINQNIAAIKSIDEKQLKDKFIFHSLTKMYKDLKTKMSSYGMLNLSILCNIPIPIPPLSEQERIVAILDKFDALVNDLTSGLPAEIEARKKQYEYYRNKLLDFK